MRDGNACVGRSSNSGRHTGDDLEANARRRERLRFLATAPKDERIAAFESHDPLSFLAETHEQRIDVVLFRRLRSTAAEGRGPQETQARTRRARRRGTLSA